MTTFYYIPSTQELINAAHIIRTRYTPNHTTEETFNEVTLEMDAPRNIKSKLEIWTTQLILTSDIGYEGNHLGSASESYCMVVYGVDADDLWQYMKSSASVLNELDSEHA